MGTPTAYKNIRLFTHLLSLVIILLNLYLLGFYAYETNFFRIEASLNLGIFDMQVCYKYTVIINIILALFASCVINSKIKYYMKVYLFSGFIMMCFLLGFAVFLEMPYRNLFLTQFGIQMEQNASTRYMVRGLLSCSDYGANDCSIVALGLVDRLRYVYIIVGVISFFLDFVIYAFARIALVLKTETPAVPVPRIERNVHVGYDSTSLRTKRFIDPNVKFKTSVISQTS
ncbi:hypothetical protein GVAV_000974 [Gurleya vavrai]